MNWGGEVLLVGGASGIADQGLGHGELARLRHGNAGNAMSDLSLIARVNTPLSRCAECPYDNLATYTLRRITGPHETGHRCPLYLVH